MTLRAGGVEPFFLQVYHMRRTRSTKVHRHGVDWRQEKLRARETNPVLDKGPIKILASLFVDWIGRGGGGTGRLLAAW